MFKIIKTADQLAQEAEAQAKQNRIAELKKLLADTDYKAMVDYDKPNEQVLADRQSWRDEIRQLESQ
jgi:hypothetical protein